MAVRLQLAAPLVPTTINVVVRNAPEIYSSLCMCVVRVRTWIVYTEVVVYGKRSNGDIRFGLYPVSEGGLRGWLTKR